MAGKKSAQSSARYAGLSRDERSVRKQSACRAHSRACEPKQSVSRCYAERVAQQAPISPTLSNR